jgi:hypothetical protein
MNEQIKFAFEFARDTVRQFLTLATGIIALTITFSKDFVSSVPDEIRIYALWSWGFMLISVFFGLLSLMALTGSLERFEQDNSQPSIRAKNITIPAGLQVISFFVGLVFVVIFGIKAV